MKQNLSLDDVCILIAGERQEEIFCRSLSISLGAYHKYGEKGLKPDVILAVHVEEYAGEEIMKFQGAYYAITHTYKRDDGLIELTGTEKAGLNSANR